MTLLQKLRASEATLWKLRLSLWLFDVTAWAHDRAVQRLETVTDEAGDALDALR